ncbi:LamG domain-containing protein [Planosporangium sp. 12N6]|uniref:LamG domain-containing protein n=1 Tax=Planosporangium spinosum TaxID=3402278 RepID=UPI003CF607A0
MGPWSTPALCYLNSDAAIGVSGANGHVQLHPSAATSDHVNLTNAGYGALASAYLGPQNTWRLNDGADDPAATIAGASASNAKNPYLRGNEAVGNRPADITGGATWTSDASRGQVITLDGTTGCLTTTDPVFNTTGSFSVSAWVNLSTLPTRNATVAGQDGTVNSAFYLQYTYGRSNAPGWAFTLPGSDTANPAFTGAYATGATTGWTHLVGTYNAATKTAQLYVNGTLAASATGATPWAASGPYLRHPTPAAAGRQARTPRRR